MVTEIRSNPDVDLVFEKYPGDIRPKLEHLRSLILEVAEEVPQIEYIEETLKWGEPSYLTKFGSTLRMDWKEKKPDQYAMYFKCTSKLVESFKHVFGPIFKYETTRAIVFDLNEEVPKAELKKCIYGALMYHKLKHLPNLGLDA